MASPDQKSKSGAKGPCHQTGVAPVSGLDTGPGRAPGSAPSLLAMAHSVEPQLVPNEVEDKFAVPPRHPDETNSHGVIGSLFSGSSCRQPRDLEGNPEGKTIGRNQEKPRSVFRTKGLFASDEGAPGADIHCVPHSGPPFGHDDNRPVYKHPGMTPSFFLIRHDQISPFRVALSLGDGKREGPNGMIGIFAGSPWPFDQIWLFRCPAPRSRYIRNHLIRLPLSTEGTPVAHRLLVGGAYRTRKIGVHTLRDMEGLLM